jgi:hypothetical protein
MLPRAAAALAFAVLAAAGCGADTGKLGQLRGDLQTMSVIDFGDVQVGVVMPYALVLANKGNGALTVTAITPAQDFATADYAFSVANQPLPFAPNESKTLAVTFQPETVTMAPVESHFVIQTDVSDGMGGKVAITVTVRGRGVSSGLGVNPNPVDFGTVLVGSSRELDFTLTNNLAGPVDLVTMIGADGRPPVDSSGNGRFEIVSMVQPSGSLLAGTSTSLPPGQSITVRARYTPDPASSGSLDRGRWGVSNCPSALCEVDVVMIGQGTNAALACDPAALVFGNLNPGDSQTQSVHCKNVATEGIVVKGWHLSTASAQEFHAQAYGGVPSNLAAGADFTVPITFSVTQATLHDNPHPNGQLVVEGTNPSANRDLDPTLIDLSGTAGGPTIAVSPTMLPYGEVAIGTVSKRHLLVENAGFSDLAVSSIQTSSSGSGGSAFRSNKSAFVVPSGASVIVDVSFTPTATTGVVATELLIASNDRDHPLVHVPLSGSAVMLPPCSYAISPAQVNFGVVPLLHATTQGLRIDNLGTDECLVNDVAITPTSSAAGTSTRAFTLLHGNETGIHIPAMGSKVIIVQYLPGMEGIDSANLGFYISDPGNSNPVVPIRGVASASAILVSPNEIDFGRNGISCSSSDRTITVYNTGAQATTIDRIELPPGASAQFELGTLPVGIPAPPGAVLQPGDSLTFSVKFHATHNGPDAAAVNVFEHGRADPYVVALYGEGSTDPVNEDDFMQVEVPTVDILFVVDNSGSMASKQAELTRNFTSFITFAEQQAIDYHIGVVTTDVDAQALDCRSSGAQRVPGLDQGQCGYFADGRWDDNPADPTWRIITPMTQPSPIVAFTAIATQGTNGSGAEKGFEGAYEALSSPKITGWNANFLRPDAYLSLIFISDADDQSPDSEDFYLNFFRSIKGFRNVAQFSVAAIVEPLGTTPDQMTSSCPDGSGEQPGYRYMDVAARTGGISQSICPGTDWVTTLQNLAVAVFGYKSRFFLTNTPVTGSIQVQVDGMVIDERAANGQVRWSYDPVANSVNFTPLAVPEPGSSIVITYRAECL